MQNTLTAYTENKYNDFRDYFSETFVDFKCKQEAFSSFLLKNKLTPAASKVAINISEGGGHQIIALANAGFSVLAIHSGNQLLTDLSVSAKCLEIEIIDEGIRTLKNYKIIKPELILCYGEILNKLENKPEIEVFIQNMVSTLAEGGKLIIAIPDFSLTLYANARFLSLEGVNEKKVCTYFFEFNPHTVAISELNSEYIDNKWHLCIKNRLMVIISPAEIIDFLTEKKMTIVYREQSRGLYTIIAKK